jgi:cytoskeletal protein CcmA (bactofilin family)
MADNETVIGPETRVSGELRGEENLLVRGRVDGKIQITETLTVEAGGIVQADVEARVVLVAGVLAGNVVASEIVRLTSKARVVGDLSAPRIVIEEGAAYRGRVEMGEVDTSRATEARATRSTDGARASSRPAAAPPRLVTPAAASGTLRAPAPPPRAVPAAQARSGPPAMPRADVAAAGGATAPAWAKKKQLKRR